MPSVLPLSLGQRLLHERLRLHWSQEKLARELGTTARSVNRWEHNKAIPHPHYRQQICQLFQVGSETLFRTVFSVEGTTLATSSFWNIPYRRNLFFTGREDILVCLYHVFHTNSAQSRLHIQALSGLGGIGKTQIAIEYAYRYRNDYSAVLWLCAETSNVLKGDAVSLANMLKLPESTEQKPQCVVAGIKRWLGTQERWLLILDNVEEMSIVQDIVPSHGRGHILMTTHVQATGMAAMCMDIEPMHPEEGALFLLRRAKYLAPDALLKQASKTTAKIAQEISLLMDGLPLGLDQAGAYIEETGRSLEDYIVRFQSQGTRLLHRRGYDSAVHPTSVSMTFSQCFQKLEQAHPAAADLLRLCAFLAYDAIPEEIIAEGLIELSSPLQRLAPNLLDLDEVLAIVRRYSLLHRNLQTKMLSMHRLVRAVLKDKMDEHTQRQWAERAVRVVNRAVRSAKNASSLLCSPSYLPHALACANLITQWQLVSLEASQLLHYLGDYYDSSKSSRPRSSLCVCGNSML